MRQFKQNLTWLYFSYKLRIKYKPKKSMNSIQYIINHLIRIEEKINQGINILIDRMKLCLKFELID